MRNTSNPRLNVLVGNISDRLLVVSVERGRSCRQQLQRELAASLVIQSLSRCSLQRWSLIAELQEKAGVWTQASVRGWLVREWIRADMRECVEEVTWQMHQTEQLMGDRL